ncbi:MAG: phosphoribosylformylglycinamidine synthase [Flavobacteriales bacterium]|nr:phosphoribosylformylglycinamidine synthase [Flavobacteriales bacterium]
MLSFFKDSEDKIYVVGYHDLLPSEYVERLKWLFGDADMLLEPTYEGRYIGPRKEMITPWSTNAVEICQNMGVTGISRIEVFVKEENVAVFDPMLYQKYDGLDQFLFTTSRTHDDVVYIDDIRSYNEKEGLALSEEEIGYLEGLGKKLGRSLTDSEVFGFSQVNSEHCRHKIFGGVFVIDGVKKDESLFQMIKNTSAAQHELLVSAYKDNVAFLDGPVIEQFAPQRGDKPSTFATQEVESVISMKAETHNFPTTVEPFNGAATGSGGEIRDRLAGGKGSLPMAGTAVYMTSYARSEKNRVWEQDIKERPWLYQTPLDILIKASNGASDFGNKFGQPLICGSVLTFEHEEDGRTMGYDKVIMLAGGVGYAKKKDALKEEPKAGDKIVVLGGDNYRIGMGGGAVSSVDTGQYASAVELNAVQRSNPEMQKRAANAIRSLCESSDNPIISIHDHGAGGHLNCLSELVESTGGTIQLDALPVGDPTLSAKEIVGNESQERMGLVLKEKDIPLLEEIASRERCPMYVVGEATGDMQFRFHSEKTGENPIDLQLSDMFGSAPKTIMEDKTVKHSYDDAQYTDEDIEKYITAVLQMEAVGCKDYLTNKVDRCVTGRVARQQNVGPLHLPLSDVGVMALDYRGEAGVATTIGHAPVEALIDAPAGSRLSISEALTNIVFAPLTHGLKGVSLSANWMWPCRNEGEDARLYSAVEAVSRYAIELGINVPTGKDSLSMTQKYPDGTRVMAPGTVIISACGEVSDVKKTVVPCFVRDKEQDIVYVDFSGVEPQLGGSAFFQMLGKVGGKTPDVVSAEYFKAAFGAVQALINEGLVSAGHDVSAGGLITTLMEMCFPAVNLGAKIDITSMGCEDAVKRLFAQNPAVVLQVKDTQKVMEVMAAAGVKAYVIGRVQQGRDFSIQNGEKEYTFCLPDMRDAWYRSSYLLDVHQSGEKKAAERYENYKQQPLSYTFPEGFTGKLRDLGLDPNRKEASGIRAAVIREKGSNSEREMAYAMYLAGFDVVDIHMTDLIEGRADLSDVNFIAAVGGFSNSDVLGSAKGWAGSFRYNEKARRALENFFSRPDTLSLGICNGCQLFVELGLITPEHDEKPRMLHNDSHKFESSFVNVDIPENHSVMFGSLAGSRLGVWVAHGEGKFSLPKAEGEYHITAKYSYTGYPANPNGSSYDAASITSADGRHLVMMPHPERSIVPWNWAYYDENRTGDEVSPWILAFRNAYKWVEEQKNKK